MGWVPWSPPPPPSNASLCLCLLARASDALGHAPDTDLTQKRRGAPRPTAQGRCADPRPFDGHKGTGPGPTEGGRVPHDTGRACTDPPPPRPPLRVTARNVVRSVFPGTHAQNGPPVREIPRQPTGPVLCPRAAAGEQAGAQAGLKALYTCTSWYAYAAMSGSSA